MNRLPSSLSSRLLCPLPLLVIVGPTASGKSALALRLAEYFQAEIVACDALQVRAGLPLLTAKPTQEEQARIPHHLIGAFPAGPDCICARCVRVWWPHLLLILTCGHACGRKQRSRVWPRCMLVFLPLIQSLPRESPLPITFASSAHWKCMSRVVAP